MRWDERITVVGGLHSVLVGMGAEIEPLTDADCERAAQLIVHSRACRTAEDPRCLSLGDGLYLAVAERLGLTASGSDQQ